MKYFSKKIKQISQKTVKLIMLISVIFSSLQTPIYVFADEITNAETGSNVIPEKGDMRLGENGDITKEGIVSVTAGASDLNKEGNVQVIKTVTEQSVGKYKVDFLIKGKKYITETSTTKDSYTVFVLDASRSMNGTPWTKAKEAAISFSQSFVTAGKNNYLALVTFNSNGYQKRTFQNAEFTSDDLGSINQGTNYNAGLTSAYNYLNQLSSEVKETASLNIIFISDGEPNSDNYSTTLSNIKSMGVNIYTFAYNLDPVKDKNAYTRLKNISTDDNVTSIESNNIDSILESFVSKVTIPTPAGTNATLSDGIGGQYKIVAEDGKDISGYGIDYISAPIKEITEEGTRLSFYIQINEDAPTGWYNTNENFSLTYTDANGDSQTINCQENPQVYWVQNQYDYIVNYYKDSITENNLLKTETRQAPANTVINESNIEKNKYLSLAGNSYEFDNLTPSSITITNDGEIKIINVLYVKAYGNLKVNYVDTEGNTLLPSVTTIKEKNTVYQTQSETIYGYALKEVKGNENGTYIAHETIEVTYIYTKNKGSVDKNEVLKTQINEIIGVNSTFNYVLSYKGTVKDYLGTATITLEDTLPYDVLTIEYPDGCTYDESTRKLTCSKTVELNEDNQTIDATFNIKVTYKNLTSLTNLNVLNKVTSSLTFGQTEVKDESEVTDTVLSGKVTAEYVDESNNTLSDSVTTTGLVDTDYQTNKKEIYGYTLKEIKGNETGKYTKEDITVTYVYTKNDGKTEKNEVIKEGPENIESVNDVFEYTLTYNGKIIDYVGKATLTLKDTLPYEIDEELSTYDDRCTYENKVLTCIETYDIDENNQEINEEFKLNLVFKSIDSGKVINKLESTLDYGKTPDKDTDETETEVLKGKVTANYVDESNNTLSDSVIITGLVDTDYQTNKKDIYGYTLKEIEGNETGKYTKEDITVTYIYSKNYGKTDKNEVIKDGPEKIESVNDVFEYTLTYNGKIIDYVGKATLTLKDTLPYEIDEEKSTYDNRCTYENKVLTCIETYDINENNQEINEEFKLNLVFKNIDSGKVTNKLESTLDYGKTPDKDTDETETEVFKGTVVATYKNKQGETLAENITQEGLSGTNYETSELEFLGYTLISVPENQKGQYLANATIFVDYIYDKNIGTSEEELEKVGPQKVTDINKPFEYNIKYNLEVFDYVGEVRITLTDHLPYEIDEEKSSIGDKCKYINGKIVCEYLTNITTIENSKISINENLILYYKNIISNEVTNKVDAKVVYGEEEKINNDEFTTEIPYGSLKVKYITEDGKSLSETIISTNLVGTEYNTEQKTFNNYYLKEVIGETSGVYTETEKEVVYVYSLVPLPPQTGVEANLINYINLLIFTLFVIVIKKRYI